MICFRWHAQLLILVTYSSDDYRNNNKNNSGNIDENSMSHKVDTIFLFINVIDVMLLSYIYSMDCTSIYININITSNCKR